MKPGIATIAALASAVFATSAIGDTHTATAQRQSAMKTVGEQMKILGGMARIGGTYDVAGPEPVSINDFIALVAEAQATRSRPVHIPAPLALLGARVLGRLMTHPPANIDQVMAFLQNTEVDIGPTMKDFQWRPRPLRQGLLETFGAHS